MIEYSHVLLDDGQIVMLLADQDWTNTCLFSLKGIVAG